ncbi:MULTISPECIES: head maturation protease, ClpP-related [unclassified Levilactobacillus]|uniref:head maturation protease, ClpP-related n=1 Tax=unclassified Levilactobacillus TaxID=2767918 RepID=UPI002FF2B145
MTKTIDIKGAVYDNDTAAFYSFFGMKVVSPSAVDEVLSDGTTDDVTVNVASNGGDVFAASEIYSMLKAYKGKVEVNIQGLAASAASVIAMAGDKVSIAPTAQIMIHKAWSGMQGNADDLAHESGVLSKIDDSIAAAYEAKTGMNQGDLLNLMSNETWMGAQEAVDKGFADEIMFVNDDTPQVVNSGSPMLPKSAVNKLLNLINKADRPKPQEPQQNKPKNSQPTDSLKSRKLAILMGKN